MKKQILALVIRVVSFVMIISTVVLLGACNAIFPTQGGTSDGIADILTEKIDGGTRITIKYNDASRENAVFVVPEDERSELDENGSTGRGVLKVEVIDGYVWVTYVDDPDNPVNIGYLCDEQETTTPDVPPVDKPNNEMPEKVNMNGYIYRAYVRSNVATGTPLEDGNPTFFCEDFWVDPNNGEPENALSYAVYCRNKEIEYDYNVKIRQVNQNGNMAQELARFYQNGDAFDLTIILAKSAAVAATQNLLTDLNSLPKLNFDHEAYDQNSIKELAIANKLYFLSGDMNISTMDAITATIVNLELYETLSEAFVDSFDNNVLYTDIYNVVLSNKWALSTMLEMAAIASVDADTTDGNLGASDQDIVGYFQYNQSAVSYFYGIGGRITEMNEESVPEFIIQTENNQELFNYLFDSLHPTQRYIRYPNGFSGDRKANFMTNANTLFTDMSLWDVRKDLYYNSNFAYGILPNPVYEEGDSYNAVVYFYNTVHLWAIPRFCENIENAQLMMNAMAAYSNLNRKDSTMDGYYTRTLYFTVAPDPNARKVMDIIKNSTVYDIALLYDWGGWETELSVLWYKRPTNNYGTLVSIMPIDAIPALEETIEQFKNPGTIYE